MEVRTTAGTLEAGRVLIAAGAWSRSLLRLENDVLQPQRVIVHWLEPLHDKNFSLNYFPVNFWQVPENNNSSFPEGFKEFYSLPALEPGSPVKVAFHNGLRNCDPRTMAREVYEDEQESIKEIISEYLPDLSGCPMHSEVCLYTMTPDKHFYLGRRPGSKNVFGVALAGHGFKFAPLLGELLADLLLDLPSSIDVSTFSPDRFEQL